MSEGGRLRFEKRRRPASIERPNGGVWVIDLGRRDRMRSLAAIVTSDLVRVDGPDLVVALTPAWSEDRGEIAVRDRLDGKGKRAAATVPVGTYRTSRYLDPERSAGFSVAVGGLDGVSGFGTFLMNGGTGYAQLRTPSGLAGFSDAGRTTFLKAVTAEHAEQARAEGFAPVVTTAGPIGVLVDCGAPGYYLALASYDAATGGTSSASSSTCACADPCTTAPSWIPRRPRPGRFDATSAWCGGSAHRSIASGWRGLGHPRPRHRPATGTGSAGPTAPRRRPG